MIINAYLAKNYMRIAENVINNRIKLFAIVVKIIFIYII